MPDPNQNPTPSLHDLVKQANATGPQSYGAGVERTGIDDASVTANEFDTFKVSKGKKERITFLDPAGVVIGRTHYVEKGADGVPFGYFICRSDYKKEGSGPDAKEKLVHMGDCCRRLGTPRKRCAGLILRYNTDKDGQLVKPFGYSLLVWRFNEKIFGQLRTANGEFPLNQHDLFVTLDGDEKYQGVQLQSCKDTVAGLPQFVSQFGREIGEQIVAASPHLARAIGRHLTNDEWAKVLGAPVSGGGTPVAEDSAVGSLEQLLNS